MSTESATAREYTPPTGPVVARAGSYYRKVRYILTLIIVGAGFWFLYDGFIGYPKENREFLAKNPAGAKEPRGPLQIQLQYALGFAMFPAAAGALMFWVRRSRGELRLDGDAVSIPGHPPFRLGDVTKVDKKLWDRKGIAYITYVTEAGQEGTFRLDDFIYDQDPTDAIYAAIINDIKTREDGVNASATPPADAPDAPEAQPGTIGSEPMP